MCSKASNEYDSILNIFPAVWFHGRHSCNENKLYKLESLKYYIAKNLSRVWPIGATVNFEVCFGQYLNVYTD